MEGNEENVMLSEVPISYFNSTTEKSEYWSVLPYENEHDDDDDDDDDGWLQVQYTPNHNQSEDDEEEEEEEEEEEYGMQSKCGWGGQINLSASASSSSKAFVSVIAKKALVQIHITFSNQIRKKVRINVNSLRNFQTPIIKTAVFSSSLQQEEEEEMLRVVLINSDANVLSVYLTPKTFTPQRASLLQTHNILSDQMYVMTPGIPLAPPSVDFLSSNKVVMALPPHLLAVDLDTKEVVSWSGESSSSSNNKAQSVLSIFKEAKDILLANNNNFHSSKSYDKKVLLPNTAALTITKNMVFTLHSDGSLRLWKCSSRSLYPLGVKCLKVPQHLFPSCHLWSHAHDSILLGAHAAAANDDDDDENASLDYFTLAIAITSHAVSSSSVDGGGADGSYNHHHPTQHLAMVWGDASSDSVMDEHLSFRKLPVALSTDKILDLKLVTVPAPSSSPTPALYTLSTASSSHFNYELPRTVFTIYNPAAAPLPTNFKTFTLNDTANDQFTTLLSSLYYPTDDSDEEEEVTLDSIDAQAMRLLFHTFKPSPSTIKRALSKLVPNYQPPSTSSSSSTAGSIQSHTLHVMKEWSQLGNLRNNNGSGGTMKRTKNVSTSATAAIVPATTTDVYHAFATTTTTTAATQDDTTSANTIPYSSYSSSQQQQAMQEEESNNNNNNKTSKIITSHRNHWAQLFYALFQEQSILSSPLCLATQQQQQHSSFSSYYYTSTKAVLIRANGTSAMLTSNPPAPSPYYNTKSSLQLDQLALSLLQTLQSNPNTSRSLSNFESYITTLISQVKLLSSSVNNNNNLKEEIPETLGKLSASVLSTTFSSSSLSTSFCGDVTSVLTKMTSKEKKQWMESCYCEVDPFIRSKLSPGFLVPSSIPSNQEYNTHSDKKNEDDDDVCASASYLALQHFSSAKQLYLARALLVFGMNELPPFQLLPNLQNEKSLWSDGEEEVLRMYLHAVGLHWVCTQFVSSSSSKKEEKQKNGGYYRKPIPLLSLEQQQQQKKKDGNAMSTTGSPPVTRARYTNSSSSFKKQYETVLDVHIAHFAKSNHHLLTTTKDTGSRSSTSMNYLSSPAILLAQKFLQSILLPTKKNNNSSDDCYLPELKLLQYTQDSSSSFFPTTTTTTTTIAEPRLALRLLAPYISYPPSHSLSSNNMNRIRREVTAEYLFLETSFFCSQSQLWDCNKIATVRSCASTLLLPQHFDDEEEEDEEIMGALLQKEDKEDPLKDVEAAFHLLRNNRNDWFHLGDVVPSVDSTQEANLASCLECLLSIHSPSSSSSATTATATTTTPSEDILRLSKIQTVQSLYLPWVNSYLPHSRSCDFAVYLSKVFYPGASEQIRLLTRVLLKISDLMFRVGVVERHTSTTTTTTSGSTTMIGGGGGGVKSGGGKMSSVLGCKLILGCVEDVIGVMTKELPGSMYRVMPEYAIIMSAEFRHALQGQQWDAAYRACYNNPVKERKMSNYRRLVLGMVDAGALKELLRLCLTLVDGGSAESEAIMDADDDDDEDEQEEIEASSIDLYEFAAETLAGVAYEQALGDGRYEEGASSSTTKPTNYAGCLYALHASRGDWRRAAQAMDAYGLTSHAAWKVSSGASSSASKSSSSASGGNRFMDDLSLSAQGSAHAIHLVDKPHQFVVSGELGPHPFPALVEHEHAVPEQMEKKTSKRGREGTQIHTIVPPATEVSEEDDAANDKDSKENKQRSNRIDRLLTASDLTKRASRNLALRTLYMDVLSPSSINTILRASDREIIDTLAQLGYYTQAISIAKMMQSKRGNACPNGLDLLFDSVRYILCKYVAPAAVRSLRPTPYNSSQEDSTVTSTFQLRPNPMQLHYTTIDGSSYVPATVIGEHWRSGAFTEDVIRGKLAMDLLCRCTVAYSSCQNTLASDVADALLDLDHNRAKLPIWLTDLLMGQYRLDDMAHGGGCGLFGNRNNSKDKNSSFAADPARLTRMYIKRGLYVEACDVISFTISKQGQQGNVGATKKNAVPSRLPEKGDIDFVPYQTIDMLWNIIEAAAPTMDPKDRKLVLDARTRMEKALKRHFEMARISEMGLQSARALVPA